MALSKIRVRMSLGEKATPTDAKFVSDEAELRRSNARHERQVLDLPEATNQLPVVDSVSRRLATDAGESHQFLLRRCVDVDEIRRRPDILRVWKTERRAETAPLSIVRDLVQWRI